MFIGEFHHNLDSKGRLAIPAKYRPYFTQGAVITRGLDRTLFLFPKEEWEKLAKKIAQLPLAKANTRAFARLMLAGAFDVELDKQGRVILPEYLRSYARLKKKLVITGVYNRLEIWDEALWEEYRKDTEKSSNDIAETLGELGV
jgi:MraZ protein